MCKVLKGCCRKGIDKSMHWTPIYKMHFDAPHNCLIFKMGIHITKKIVFILKWSPDLLCFAVYLWWSCHGIGRDVTCNVKISSINLWHILNFQLIYFRLNKEQESCVLIWHCVSTQSWDTLESFMGFFLWYSQVTTALLNDNIHHCVIMFLVSLSMKNSLDISTNFIQFNFASI